MRFISSASLFAVAAAAQGLPPFLPEHQQPVAASDNASPVASIPPLGFGTWNLSPQHANASKAVEAAIIAGYRHIDCAAAYRNEKAVGAGIAAGLRAAKLSRTDLWVTSKLWNTAHEPAAVLEAAEQTLNDLGVGHLDLYLMHWPVAENSSGESRIAYLDTWRAMSELRPRGYVRHIGVSNFSPAQMLDLLAHGGGVLPYAHQMELHPYLPQHAWLMWHATAGIRVTAYSPLGNMNPTYDGQREAPESLLESEEVKKIAKRSGCTPAQVVLKWGLTRGVSVIPKSQHVQRIEENFGAPACELRYEDFDALEEIGAEPFRFNNPSKQWGVDLYEGLSGM